MELAQILFQKDLIVWKLNFFIHQESPSIEFQKDLIVWKRLLPIPKPQVLLQVSEGLNSVETNEPVKTQWVNFSFQKDLIVWKLIQPLLMPA